MRQYSLKRGITALGFASFVYYELPAIHFEVHSIMKKFGYIFVYLLILLLFIFGIFASVGVLNSDLYGRLTETEPYQIFNSTKRQNDSLPSVIFILHKYLDDENAVEVSLIVSYERHNIFSNFHSDHLEILIRVIDGYNYSPSGFNGTFTFSDSVNRKSYGYFYSGYESERFILPISPSLYGFPFDNIKVRPLIDLYVNENNSAFNFSVQKRLPGRVFNFDQKEKEVIDLTRTSTEKCLVVISSLLFLLLTSILTYSLFKHKTGLNTVEELIAVAGYILATAGFREIVGVTRSYGTSTLEILVILIPLFSVTLGLIFSYIKGQKAQT
jgi:hypothetical protein